MLTDEANLSIEVMRGDFVEESHEVAACLCDASGYVRARIGSPHVTTWRSAAKPFQLEACLTMLPRDTVETCRRRRSRWCIQSLEKQRMSRPSAA